MKVVLQHKKTRLYFKRHGQWVSSAARAKNFRSSLTAMDYCLNRKVADVQIILMFSDAEYNIPLRVLDGIRASASANT